MRFSPAHTDEQLLKGCRKNKRQAQQALYQKYHEPMMRVCMRYAHDEGIALEILNDGFLKVFDKIGSFKEKGAFGGWIRQIMVRTALDKVRSQQSYRRHLDQFAGEIGNYAFENEAINQLEGEDIFRHLQALPPVTRTVFNLYALEGYSHREIAQLLEMSEGTSQWHVSTARKKLKPLFQKKTTINA